MSAAQRGFASSGQTRVENDPLRRGPKPVVAQPAADLDQLRRENARLRQRLEHAEAIIEVQKKVAALLGMPMATTERDETP